jgi:PIN domain nuclease of toxin-antitoxin system
LSYKPGDGVMGRADVRVVAPSNGSKLARAVRRHALFVDPFDRMIVAQARVNHAAKLITRDRWIRRN